ncbi:hypothetical protein [Fusobacterium canifelinum]|uniref:Sulfatase-modifying factor enzyme domain-containing protein n=1 Tax=Fusobacterium canifelinum TaxID=285729 RepID=A0A3P1V376_9FUSO|nr:hypothetical protein [Fusobacterium canifelinum]QQS86709.1 hypothetical protein I6I83_06540 [Fusobacterium canifelinum]RRD28328.1 hypothetical protein EII27_01525 [Fusobacterium canifelinum]
MKDLYNDIYSKLSEEKKKEILKNLAKKYNMEILRFETFSKYSKSTFTAVFKYKESEFVFVPGDTVTLGYEDLPKNLSNETIEGLKYCLDESEDWNTVLEEYIRDNFSKLRKATIKPMLVERKLQTVAWRKSNLEELKDYDIDLLKDYNEFKSSDYNRLTLDETARFTKVGADIEIELYDDISYEELCENLKEEGFFLANLDEWEYLCGGGCRTLFPWGDDLDYNMNLLYFSKKGNDKYDLEEPNFFGLSIAYDPYKMEIIDNKSFSKGGDGGCNICGGYGDFLGYLPSSPYFNQVIDYEEEDLNGDFNFYRRIIRIGE